MRSTVLSFAALLAAAASSAVAAPEPQALSDEAAEVLNRTKTVSGTYALYVWNRITLPGQEPMEEWSAEFHSGNLHRVETPRDRVVADCGAGTGTHYSVTTGQMTEGAQVARAACGIDTNSAIISGEVVAVVQTPFGEAERVRITDPEHVREYDVSEGGVLLSANYAENDPEGHMLLRADAVAVEAALPGSDMFERNSLGRSFVPDKYRNPPARGE